MLMIQNKGVAPTEAYTLLGYSTARDSGVDGTIGQFGTGAKHGICVLLRAGIDVRVYCGTDRLIFGTREDNVNGKPVTRVTVTVNKRKPKDLDWILDFGAIDWTEVRMALREFVSNAIDQSLLHDENLVIKFTDKVQARDGYTRVFVEDAEQVRDFYNNLSQHFLHFEGKESQRIIEKDAPGPCRIYREGVFIRQIDGKPALCDYNFGKHDINIDECRNMSDYAARSAIAQLYSKATREDYVRLFTSILNGEETLESNLDSFYLTYRKPTEDQRIAIKTAWEQVSGGAVPCSSSTLALGQFAQKKGFCVKEVHSDTWVKALDHFGILPVNKVLDGSEVNGNEVTPPTFEAIDAVNKVWEWLEAVKMTNGQAKPPVKGFDSIMSGGEEMLGYVLPGDKTVYLRNDLGGQMLLQAALEEVVHSVTGATDGSRDLQDFAFRMITRWLA